MYSIGQNSNTLLYLIFTVHYYNFTLQHIGLKDNIAEVEGGLFLLHNKRKPFVQW